MKDTIIIGLLIVSIVLSIVSLIRSGSHAGGKESATQVAAMDSAAMAQASKSQPVVPGEIMTRLQRNMNKLWFAGNAQNWPLANFYVSELKEAMEIIRDNNVVEDSVDLSPLMSTYGLAPLEQMQSVVNGEEGAKFKSQYMTQISNCNSCHMSAKHPFVVIKEPTTPAYDNQVYTKK